MKFIVTVKINKNPNHDPNNKRYGECPVMHTFCTDMTGEHHSFLIDAKNITEANQVVGKMGFTHVTRIESI